MKELSDEMQKANNFPILMAGKYNNPILKDNYITKNRDYSYVARDFGLTPSELYCLLQFKCGFNKLKNGSVAPLPKTGMFSRKREFEREFNKVKKANDELMQKEAVFSNKDVWKLLAYYQKHFGNQTAKTVFKRLKKCVGKKYWHGVKQMFTPLNFPDSSGTSMVTVELIKCINNGDVWEAKLINKKPTRLVNESLYADTIKIKMVGMWNRKFKSLRSHKIILIVKKAKPYLNYAEINSRLDIIHYTTESK